ncbi:VPS64 Vacuolar protein sorting-associated protein 64 [Candida maltosa Xu316]
MPAKPKYTTATTSRDQSKGLSNGNSSLLTKSSPGPSPLNPRKRNQVQYYVTLLPLNDTFVKKHLPVATYPETTKLGRPTGTKHKPDVTNGYFDSRVLSRNHAQIYIDPKNGKLMLQDLGSSNGTYLNDARLNNDPTEVKMGDIVCLGFNVQAESTHKQISLKIENINVISTSLTGDKDSTANNGTKSNNEGFDSPEFKQLAFVEDIYQQIEHQQQNKRSNESVFPNIITFDDALFADVNEEALRDYSLNAGIYNNSQITTTSNMEQIINLLINDLARVKQQASSLNALSNFFQNYYRKLDRLNQDYLDHQVKNKLAQVEHELSKEKAFSVKLKDKFKLFESETNKNIDGLNIKLKKCDEEKIQLTNLFKDLQCKNESLEQDEEEEEHEQEERESSDSEEISDEKSSVAEDNRDDEVKSEFESIVATNSIPKDDKEKEAEPFPTKMEETGKKSSSSFTTTRSTSTSTSARRKLSAAKIENIQTFGIALSAMLVGYFLQNIVGKIG